MKMVALCRHGSDGEGNRNTSLQKLLLPSEPGLLLDIISSEELLSFACPLYRIVNYQKGGSIVEAYQKGGDEEVMRFAIDHLAQFIHCWSDKHLVENLTDTNLNEVTLPIEDAKENQDFQDFARSEKICWRREYRGLLGESPLHVLIFCNTPMHINIAKLLLRAYPDLAADVMECEDYLGVSALHLAIAFRNFELVKILVKNGANVCQRAVGCFFLPYDQQKTPPKKISDFKSLFYMGEYPLAWAACHDDESTYNLLVKHGAHPDMQDSFGNTVLHTSVIQNKLSMYGYALRHPVKPAHDNILNNYGLTPLTLACKLGRNEVFQEMLELSAIEFWRYSNITCSAYPLSALDSISSNGKTNQNSALMIILNGTSKEHLDMLDGEVIQRLLEEKWKTFARQLFLKRLVLMLLHLALLGVAVYLRPRAKISLQRKGSDAANIVRYCAELGACMTCGAFVIFQEMREIKARGVLVFLTNLSGNVPKAIFLLSDIFILLCILCRLSDQRHLEDCFFTLAIVGSWIYLLFFAGAIRLTGLFITMISKMLTGDMFRFSIIYVVFLLGFTQAFRFVSKNSDKDNELPDTYSKAWMSLFHHTLGVYEDGRYQLRLYAEGYMKEDCLLGDRYYAAPNHPPQEGTFELGTQAYELDSKSVEYGDFDSTVYPMLSKLVFTVFMVLMPILLLNMLIAMMASTYIKVIAQSEREWMRQWARIVLSLERAVPQEQAKEYLDSYSLALPPDGSGVEQRAVLVIKTKSITKAKQRKRALTNWKKVGKRLISAVRQCGGTAQGVHVKLLSGVPLIDFEQNGMNHNPDTKGRLGDALRQLDFAHDLGLSRIMSCGMENKEENKITQSVPVSEDICAKTSPIELNEDKCLENANNKKDFHQNDQNTEKLDTVNTGRNDLAEEAPLGVQFNIDVHRFYHLDMLKQAATQYNIHVKKCDASTSTCPIVGNLCNVETELETQDSERLLHNSVITEAFAISSCCSDREEINPEENAKHIDINRIFQFHKSCQVNNWNKMSGSEDYETNVKIIESVREDNLCRNVKRNKTCSNKKIRRRRRLYKCTKQQDESESDDVESKESSSNNLSSVSGKKRNKFLKMYKRKCRKNRVSDAVYD